MRKREIKQVMSEIETVRKYSDEYLNQQIKNIYKEAASLESKISTRSFVAFMWISSAIMLSLVSLSAALIPAVFCLFPISSIISNASKLNKNKKFLDGLIVEQKRRYENVKEVSIKKEKEQTIQLSNEKTISKQEFEQEKEDVLEI